MQRMLTLTADILFAFALPCELALKRRVCAHLVRCWITRQIDVTRIMFSSLLDRAYDAYERSVLPAVFRWFGGDRWVIAERASAGALFLTGLVLLRGLSIGDLPELRSMRLVYTELYGWAFAMILFGGTGLASTFARVRPLRIYLGFSVTMIYLALCYAFWFGGAPTQFIWPPLATLTTTAACAFLARVASDNADRPGE